jgi:hypothetical protein
LALSACRSYSDNENFQKQASTLPLTQHAMLKLKAFEHCQLHTPGFLIHLLVRIKTLDFTSPNSHHSYSRFSMSWPMIEFTRLEYIVCEDVGTLSVGLRRIGETSQSSYTSVTLREMSAKAGEDFGSQTAAQIQFDPGNLLNHSIPNLDETISAHIFSTHVLMGKYLKKSFSH